VRSGLWTEIGIDPSLVLADDVAEAVEVGNVEASVELVDRAHADNGQAGYAEPDPVDWHDVVPRLYLIVDPDRPRSVVLQPIWIDVVLISNWESVAPCWS
jgi:hypothetical protein